MRPVCFTQRIVRFLPNVHVRAEKMSTNQVDCVVGVVVVATWWGCCLMRVRSYFLVFVPTVREIRDFYREMQRTNRESITMYRFGIAGDLFEPTVSWVESCSRHAASATALGGRRRIQLWSVNQWAAPATANTSRRQLDRKRYVVDRPCCVCSACLNAVVHWAWHPNMKRGHFFCFFAPRSKSAKRKTLRQLAKRTNLSLLRINQTSFIATQLGTAIAIFGRFVF
eukprot:SAG31_NODE_4544_length_3150_cov_1.620125_3_plen_225_part_00